MMAAGFAAFLTGVTEPLEFALVLSSRFIFSSCSINWYFSIYRSTIPMEPQDLHSRRVM